MIYGENFEIDYKAIGKRIRSVRKKKHLKQSMLSAMTGVAETNISHIERGATKLSLPTLIKIANALDVSVDELLCDSLSQSKKIYISEIAEILDTCNEKELRIISSTINAIFSEIHDKLDN